MYLLLLLLEVFFSPAGFSLATFPPSLRHVSAAFDLVSFLLVWGFSSVKGFVNVWIVTSVIEI